MTLKKAHDHVENDDHTLKLVFDLELIPLQKGKNAGIRPLSDKIGG